MTDKTRRLSEFMGIPVRLADGREAGHVIDVRLAPTDRIRGVHAELAISGLVVDRRHTGSLLGYDRHREQGPWLVSAVIRLLHRHAGYVAWADVAEVDLDGREIRLSVNELAELDLSSGDVEGTGS